MSETETHPQVQITIINVLPLKYFADCQIKDSINIEVDKIPDSVEDWDRTKFIVVYGASDDLTISKLAYKKLIGMGFIYIRILLGGMQGMVRKWLPLSGKM